MSVDRDDNGGRVPLAGVENSYSAERPVARRDGIRHARRVSNWTAAALIVGTGAAAVALAHQAVPPAAPAAGTTVAGAAAPAAGATVAGAAAPAAGAATPGTAGPRVSHSVATTSASGVTTTTRTVNGKTVVSRVRHAPVGRDD